MVKKKNIGIIQLIIGILILVAFVIWGIMIIHWNKVSKENAFEDFKRDASFFENKETITFSNESKTIMAQNIMQKYEDKISEISQKNLNLWLFFILDLIISLLFTTQGLLNYNNK